MSAKLKLLREMLLGIQRTTGTVLSLSGTNAQVATATGTVTASVPQGVKLALGDAVTVQDGIVRGRVRGVAGVRVYDL